MYGAKATLFFTYGRVVVVPETNFAKMSYLLKGGLMTLGITITWLIIDDFVKSSVWDVTRLGACMMECYLKVDWNWWL